MEQLQTSNKVWEEMKPTGTPVKVKRTRKNPPSLPMGAAANEMEDAQYNCKVDNTPTSWESLPLWTAFSISSDGSYPKVKVSKSKFCDLRTNKAESVGSGRCYQIIF